MGELLWFSPTALGTTNNVLMKPKMLLVGGWNHSGTSPLVCTLQRNAKYAHFGYTKQLKYLPSQDHKIHTTRSIWEVYKHVLDGTWENYMSDEPGSHRMNETIDYEPLRDFPVSYFTKLMTGERTARKLVDFYHALHDHVLSKGYKSVGDCYIGWKHRKESLSELFKTLASEFDVKFLLIARDPIRRSNSYYLFQSQRHIVDKEICTCDLGFPDYIKDLNRAYKLFGKDNVHLIVMEELWEGDGTAKKQLSQFLDHPITDLWKNLYAPDRGHLMRFDRDVPCQAYGQSLEKLTPENYYHYKERYKYIYDSWEDTFGSLPLHWGQPITYS